MNQRVQDGVFVNQTGYEREQTMIAERFTGRRNLHNSAQDALDKKLKLIIAYNSLNVQNDQVSFDIADFQDGLKNNNRIYKIQIDAVERPVVEPVNQVSVSAVDPLSGVLTVTRVAHVKGTPPAFVPLPSGANK